MGALLTETSTLFCPHGGVVRAVATSPRVRVDGAVLGLADPATISGCAAPIPCVTVVWVSGASRVRSGQLSLLVEESVGVCHSAQGTPQGNVVAGVAALRARAI